MRKLLVLILFIVTLSGCSTTMVLYDKDGQPIPTYELNMSTMSEKNPLKMRMYLVRVFEESQYSSKPEYLDFFKEQLVNLNKTTAMFLILRVTNASSAEYQIDLETEYIAQDKSAKLVPVKYTEIVYKGSDQEKTWQIPLNIKWTTTYQTTLTVLDKNKEPLFIYGPLKYRVTGLNK
jgi:hypothetical protein